MRVHIDRIIILVLFLSVAAGVASGCMPADADAFDIGSVISYRDIPGVTDADIAAVEALKLSYGSFSYVSATTTESFILPDGTYAGFSYAFCEMLSGLFGIPFVLEARDWAFLKSGIDDLTIDFTGEMTPTRERRESYLMTHPIAQRTLGIFTYGDSVKIESENDLSGLRIGFLEGTITAQSVSERYPDLSFEIVTLTEEMPVVDMLKDGFIDAHINDAVAAYLYDDYEQIRMKEALPLIYTPVSLSTANPVFEPIINVVDKYIEAGGIDKLYEIYKAGSNDYSRYMLSKSLTDVESAYLSGLSASVPIVMDTKNYPISFYSEPDQEFQGISADVISKISMLTGIEFEVINDKDTLWADTLEMLLTGKAVMVSELFITEERKEHFIWPENPYFSSPFAFISKFGHPALELYQIEQVEVGLVRGTAHEEMYHAWFPGSSSFRLYGSTSDMLDALEMGDVDLVLASTYTLLHQQNYREKPDYKVNYAFPVYTGSYFGFNSNESVLCSIVDKALAYVDTDGIAADWTARVYDFSRAIQQVRYFNAVITVIVLALGTIFLIVLYVKNVKRGKLIARQAAELVTAKDFAEQGSRAKSDFLAKMSHEIRTPMNAIIGMTELVLREDISEAARENAVALKQAGSNLLTLINDILDFSKIETGKMEIIPTDYSVASLINDVISIIRMRLLDSEVRFAVSVDSDLPATLFGDEMRVRQVLINVLGNAVKYTEKGYIFFTVTGEFAGEDTVNIVFEVMDSGRGIKRTDTDRFFEDFAQFDLEKNKGIEGVGLGLAITNSIVKASGGTISVQSEYGKGSIFTIVLPQKFNNRMPLASVENPADKKVLLYERRETHANSIIYTIGNLGVDGELVKSDSELYSKLSSQSFDFIFISFALYMKNKDIIMAFAMTAKTIILTEFGEVIPDTNVNILSMPVYCVSIASILNGAYDSFSYDVTEEAFVSFSAPEAMVLIVDDINTNLKVAQGLLMPYNMRVDLCKSGKDAINALQSKKYDLVFMDHKMPEMDGVETTQRIREMGADDPYYSKVPIVALTANAVAGTMEMFLENGFDDFLSKPIDTVKLNTILERWIPKRKQQGMVPEQNVPNVEVSLTIAGIDVEKGIAKSGGITNYYDAIEAFYTDAMGRVGDIELCADNGNIQLFTTHVHGLKSATKIIGADKLSESAEALEIAGKQGDLDYITKQTPGFVRDLKTLLNNFDYGFKDIKQVGAAFDFDALKLLLEGMKSALDSFDAGAMNRIINSLLELTRGNNISIAISKIADSVLMGEYDEAAELVEELMRSSTEKSQMAKASGQETMD